MKQTLITTALIASLAACGGGGGGSPTPTPTPTPTPQKLSGTAAAGLPIVGSVTVKDATGKTVTVPIDNGSYSVDVTGLTAPFMLRASGMVGDREYVIHSAATSADVNATLNITPLTDLIVANVAGQIAARHFDAGQFAGLSKAELDAEAAQLRTRLLPMLQAMGVDAATDLLRTPFTPLSSALDKTLDAIRVTVDPSTQVATLANIVTQQRITDDLKTKAAAETGAAKMDDTANLATAKDDVPAIRASVKGFFDLFAKGLPSAAALKALTTSDFLLNDASSDDWAAWASANAQLVGNTAPEVVVQRIDYSDPARAIAEVSFVVHSAQGVPRDIAKRFLLAKGSDKVWRLHGNQRKLDINASAHHVLGQDGCMYSGLEFWIEDNNRANSSNVSYVVIKGPGLPASGVRLNAPAGDDHWLFDASVGQPGSYYRMAGSCAGSPQSGDAVIAAIPDQAEYEIRAYTSAGAPVALNSSGVYRETVARRPLTQAELKTSLFPRITAPTTLKGYAGGSLSISASNLPAGRAGWVFVNQQTSKGNYREAEGDTQISGSGTLSTTLSLGAVPAGDTVTRTELRVQGTDAFWRRFMTLMVDGQ